MIKHINYCLVLTLINLFGQLSQAADCYSCKSSFDTYSIKWFTKLERTLGRLDAKPQERKDCHNADTDLPKIYCRSKCVKELFVGGPTNRTTYVVRYCLDETHNYYEREITVNNGLGDMRPETCQTVVDESSTICICQGHLCNGSVFTAESFSLCFLAFCISFLVCILDF